MRKYYNITNKIIKCWSMKASPRGYGHTAGSYHHLVAKIMYYNKQWLNPGKYEMNNVQIPEDHAKKKYSPFFSFFILNDIGIWTNIQIRTPNLQYIQLLLCNSKKLKSNIDQHLYQSLLTPNPIYLLVIITKLYSRENHWMRH